MSLYLCVFDEADDELEGVDVGRYSDFDFFRSTISKLLENNDPGSRFPILMLHSDCDGEWSPAECDDLRRELQAISRSFRELPGIQFRSDWQQDVSSTLGLRASSLYDSFIDVDGEPLLERLIQLCDVAIRNNQPILFQ